jgi:flavorubredoxin
MCEIASLGKFHKCIMTSTKALRFTLEHIEKLDISIIAPQHGSLLHTPSIQKIVMKHLKALEGVGIDQFLEGGGQNV